MTESRQFELNLSEDSQPEEILVRLDEALRVLGGDVGYLEDMRTVVPGVGEVIGVRVPQLRTLAAQIAGAYRGEAEFLLDLARRCWGRGSREHLMIALFMLARMKKLTPQERWYMVEIFLPDVNDWETCDQLCAALSGQALAEDAVYMDQLESWVGDDNFWVRRVAIVSTVLLRRAGFDKKLARSLDTRTLKMCERLLDDNEKYIRKAVDWALRELINRSYEMGREFLMEKAAQNPAYPAKATLKLAAKKLKPTDQKRFTTTLEG